MNIDERIEAIAMNLELLGHRVEDSRREHETAMLDLRENVNSIAKTVAQMLVIAQTHDKRITTLERHEG